MHLAVVASPVTPLTPAQTGGAQSIVVDLARGLRRRGHRVSLYCAEGSVVEGVDMVTVPVDRHAVRSGLVVPGNPDGAPSPALEGAIAALFEKLAWRGADAISQHAFDAAAMERSHGLPVLHTLHLPPVSARVVDALRAVPRHRLAAVSQAGRRDWAAAGVQVGHVLRNGVDAAMPRHGPVRRMALAAGRLSPEKGVEHALQAARLADIPLRVAGAAYADGYRPDLSGAEVLGPIPRADLRRIMAESAVAICAVRWEEPFGLVAAEAQMAGCPVAGYRRGALPEVIEPGVSGLLVDPDDVEALAEAVTGCLGLDRARVRDSARRRLGLEAMLDAYEAALSAVTG